MLFELLLRGRSILTPERELLLRVLLGRLYTLSAPDALRTVRPDCAVALLSLRVAPPALTPDDAREGPLARGTKLPRAPPPLRLVYIALR